MAGQPARPFEFDRAPDSMLVERRWVCWRLEPKPDRPKPTKVPYQATGEKAGSTYPHTWCSWREAVAAVGPHRMTGIGFVLGDGWLGVDVDHAVTDGRLSPLAQGVVEHLGGYAELSPSQTGIHVILKGQMPDGRGRKRGQVEMYGGGRFFTFTGWFLGGDRKDESGYHPAPPEPSEPSADELRAFHDIHFPPDVPKNSSHGFGGVMGLAGVRRDGGHQTGGPLNSDQWTDDELIERILRSKNGAKFEALFEGNWKVYFGSQSEADLSLVSTLRWWTNGDIARMDRLYRRSKLFRPKWDSRRGAETYGQRTLRKSG